MIHFQLGGTTRGFIIWPNITLRLRVTYILPGLLIDGKLTESVVDIKGRKISATLCQTNDSACHSTSDSTELKAE